jgi:aryl-alcohol dehydrogenase-like predicted oxidoreductase
VVGRAIRNRRDEVVVATKFGFRIPGGAPRHTFLVGYVHGELAVNAHPDLVQDGLVRHLGLSNVTADQLRRAHAGHPVAAVQTEWSMWRPVADDLLATARELGVGIVAWSPLGGGFLTGTVTSLGEGDFRHNAPRFAGGNLAANHDRYTPVRHSPGASA